MLPPCAITEPLIRLPPVLRHFLALVRVAQGASHSQRDHPISCSHPEIHTIAFRLDRCSLIC
jgi:hypothetical protein